MKQLLLSNYNQVREQSLANAVSHKVPPVVLQEYAVVFVFCIAGVDYELIYLAPPGVTGGTFDAVCKTGDNLSLPLWFSNQEESEVRKCTLCLKSGDFSWPQGTCQ